ISRADAARPPGGCGQSDGVGSVWQAIAGEYAPGIRCHRAAGGADRLRQAGSGHITFPTRWQAAATRATRARARPARRRPPRPGREPGMAPATADREVGRADPDRVVVWEQEAEVEEEAAGEVGRTSYPKPSIPTT